MEPVLYLTHRIPYPPNKGDKITTFHFLRFLAARYRVYLGTFIDDPADEAHRGVLPQYCADAYIGHLDPRLTRLWSARGLLTGEALTLTYYRDRALHAWIDRVVREQGIRRAVIYSSAMAQYTVDRPELRTMAQFADVDSLKWSEYAERHPWPLSYVYRREGEKLLAFERYAAARSAACGLCTDAEAKLFAKLAPECASRLHVIRNGVDTEYFAPAADRASPFTGDEQAIVFTGAMDYWPNIDAVQWFTQEMLPTLLTDDPRLRFYIVGMNPSPAVRALAAHPRVVVTGRVPDVRPYLQHARVVVAPLRIARGVQNKVLEAMAMVQPVVVAAPAVSGVSGVAGEDFETAADAQEFVAKVRRVLDPAVGRVIGANARARVVAEHNWDRNLALMSTLLEGTSEAAATPRAQEAFA